MKKIRRRLSQTFRLSLEGSLSELAEQLTIEDSQGVKGNGAITGFPDMNRKLSFSHSRIFESSNISLQVNASEETSISVELNATRLLQHLSSTNPLQLSQ